MVRVSLAWMPNFNSMKVRLIPVDAAVKQLVNLDFNSMKVRLILQSVIVNVED